MAPLPNHHHIEMVKRTSLTENPNSPRKHTDKHHRQIADSIRRFGFLVPLIIDDEGLIVAGHGRWIAAGLLDLDDIPIIRARFLSEADRRAFALAENRLSDLSSWDQDKLNAELEFLFEQDYDLDVTGFSVADLDFSVGEESGTEDPVELPSPDTKAVSRPGDLWLIGPHRLYCGNSRDAASYEALLAGERAAMVFSDPPYNVPVDGHVSGLGKHKHRAFAEASGEMTRPEFTTFLRSVFRQCVQFSTDGSIHYQCMDWRHIREMLDAADGVYSEYKQLVVWAKGNAGMGSFYRSQHELIFVFKSGKARHLNNFGLGETGRHRSNLWSYAGANTFRKGRDQDLADHPTVKSLPMVVDAILDCSNRGDLILDPFSGSGTTLLAAHRARRRCAAIEIDPLYVDTGLRRLQAATGLIPTLPDGRDFDDVVADRAGENDHD
jgi:DNA modification methylase